MLQTVPDKQLIDDILTKNSSVALSELTARHSGLINDSANKYVKNFCVSGHLFEDVLSNPELTVYKAVQSYDPNRNTKFTTWLGSIVRWGCLKKIKEEKSHFSDIDIENADAREYVYVSFKDKNPTPAKSASFLDDLLYIKEMAAAHPDRRVSVIINERYFSGPEKKPFSKIGPLVGLSYQGAINIHDAFIKDLKKDFDFNFTNA